MTLAAQALLDGEAAALTRKAIELAKAGDTTALKLCMDRLLPPRRGRPVLLQLPTIANAGDVVGALGATIKEMAAGGISPDEAATIAGVLETKRRAIETAELEARLVCLEQQAGG